MTGLLPKAPQGVRGSINGVEYPMKVRYIGPCPEGHLWEAVWPEDVAVPTCDNFRGLKCDMMPGQTVLTVEVRHVIDGFT